MTSSERVDQLQHLFRAHIPSFNTIVVSAVGGPTNAIGVEIAVQIDCRAAGCKGF